MGRWLAGIVLLLNLGAPLFAASAVTEDDVRAWLALWQKREGLEHWDIRLRIVRASELPRDDDGEIEWWNTPGTANIELLCAADMQGVFGRSPASARRETELVIVHELMHLVIAQLYDDGSGAGDRWLSRVPGGSARMETITENLAVMLLRRRVPAGYTEAQYIRRVIDSGPWRPSVEVRERVMLQLLRAMEAASEDEVMALLERER